MNNVIKVNFKKKEVVKYNKFWYNTKIAAICILLSVVGCSYLLSILWYLYGLLK
jgi:hypothetical protein